VDQSDDRVYRLRPRPNPQAQGHFMCDEGRFGWKYVHRDERLTLPEQRRKSKVVSRDWEQILPAVQAALVATARDEKRGIAAVFSPWMTLEEAYLLAGYLTSLSRNVSLAIAPARILGEDDKYPKDVRGRTMEPVKFTIRAEKCPNRRGVETILRHFAGDVVPMGDVLGRAAAGDFSTMYLVGGDPTGWISDQQAAATEYLDTLIVQDILPSPASRLATFVLPGGSFAERDGTFVNHAGLAQEIRRSMRGPGEARPDGRILWDLAGRRGLFNAAQLRREMGEAIESLRPLASGQLGDHGVRLFL
jgi:NADH-quinone oxidoreductase subunit G